MKKAIFISGCMIIFFIHTSQLISQNNGAWSSGNYGGILQTISNPAFSMTGKLKADILLTGFELSFNNSWGAIKSDALSFPDLPDSWKNYTPDLPGNIYKNFEWQKNDHHKEVVLEQRIILPSFLIKLNSNNAVGLISGIRQHGNISGISPALAHLFEQEFDLSVLQNNPVENRDFVALRMSWIEYGLNYSHRFVAGHHHLAAGVTPKILQGLESSFIELRDLSFLFSNKDTLSYLDADFTVAHSSRTGSVLDLRDDLAEKIRHSASPQLGFDLGIIYEWRPPGAHPEKKQKRGAEPDRYPYKLRVGAAITDIGGITFQKEPNYYEMQISLRQNDIIRYISAENVQMVDSLLETDFPVNTGDASFRVKLPSAFRGQIDYPVTNNLYVNVSSYFDLGSREALRVRNYKAICLAPRFESYWLDASLLLTWNALSAKRGQYITPGISLRAGPLTVGSADLSILYKKDITSLHLFAMLRVMIPDSGKRDRN